MDRVKISVSIQLPRDYGYQGPPNHFDPMEKPVSVFTFTEGRELRSTCLILLASVTVFMYKGKYVIGVLTKYSFFFIKAVSPASPLRWKPHQWIIEHKQAKVECSGGWEILPLFASNDAKTKFDFLRYCCIT